MKRPIFCALVVLALIGIQGAVRGTPGKDAKLEIHRLAIPDKPWAIEIAASPEYTSVKKFETEGGFYLQNQKNGMSVLAILEKASSEGDAAVARDYYTKKENTGGLQMEDVKQYAIGEAAVREYMIKDSRFKVLGGDTVVVRNVNCFLSHDGYWARIKISKLEYRDIDQKLFDEILANIKIVPL